MQVSGAAEILEAKRSALELTGESLGAVGEDRRRVLRSPPPSIDSDSFLCSYLDDQAIRPLGHGSYAQIDCLNSPCAMWGLDVSRKLAEASLLVSDVSSSGVLQVSGPSSSGTMGRSRDPPLLTAASGEQPARDLPAPEISAGSDVQLTTPSRTTAGGARFDI